MNAAQLSVIVPSYNGIQKLPGLMESLESQTVTQFEVVVVIDGSTDGSKEYLEAYRPMNFDLVILFQENSGRSKARNAGVLKSIRHLILFVDDDIKLSANGINCHLKHHAKYQYSVLVGGQYLSITDHSDFEIYRKTIENRWYQKLPIYPEPLRHDNLFATAAHLSLPKELFYSIGRFDDSLTDCEDWELGLRLINEGVNIYFDGRIFAEHLDKKTCSAYIDRKIEYSKALSNLKKTNILAHKLKGGIHKFGFVKSLIYKVLSHSIWIDLIDNNLLNWIPHRGRYPLYSAVIHAAVIYSSDGER